MQITRQDKIYFAIMAHPERLLAVAADNIGEWVSLEAPDPQEAVHLFRRLSSANNNKMWKAKNVYCRRKGMEISAYKAE